MALTITLDADGDRFLYLGDPNQDGEYPIRIELDRVGKGRLAVLRIDAPREVPILRGDVLRRRQEAGS